MRAHKPLVWALIGAAICVVRVVVMLAAPRV